MRQQVLASLTISTLACALCSAQTQPYFIGLGDLPGNTYYSNATSLSADGSVVGGKSLGSRCGNGYSPFHWTMQGGMIDLGDLPGGACESAVSGVSGDGLRFAGSGNAQYGQGWVWQANTGLIPLGDLGGPPSAGSSVSGTSGISTDGRVIVGSATSIASHNSCAECLEACRWVWTNGVWVAEALGALPGADYSGSANAVSSDGSVIVGTSRSASNWSEAFVWTAGSGMQGLGRLPGASASRAKACSADGTVVVGQSGGAFRWTAQGGMERIGDGNTDALAVSPDGSLVVGRDWGVAFDGAFIWDEINGVRRLSEVLVSEYGLDLSGWSLLAPLAFSADGLNLVGGGYNSSGEREAWLVYLGDSCYADCDKSTGNGVLDIFDFLCFQNSFVNGEAYACDCDTSTGNGVCDVFDFLCFQNAFVGGCP